MPGSHLRRSWEISTVPEGSQSGGAGKGNRNPAIDAVEKSDAPVVPKKRPNKGQPAEDVEERGAAKGNADESPACRTPGRGNALTGLERVRETARRERRLKFTALLHHITPSLLVESFYDLKRTAAAGVDGVTWQDYESVLDGRVHELHRQIHTGAYRAQASRRVFIPKADGKLRPLGIAAVEDKIVQQAVVKVLSAIYETDFLGFSYGFRPGRGQHDALDAVWMGIETRQIRWILDADISAYFDTIDHDWMLEFLQHRIADRRLLRLIRKWLKAGIVEDGRRVEAERGTPQGAVISPLLANIYLHYVFDTWAQHWRKHHARGDIILIRYADDSVLGFQYENEARRFLAEMHERFARFGLTLHPEKTRLIEFGRYAEAQRKRRGEGRPETFDFLGFTHCCAKTRQGRFKILRLTVKKRLRATLAAIRGTLKRRRHEPIGQVGAWLTKVLRGYFNYHAVPDNLKRLAGFRWEVCRAWYESLNRRSQKKGMTGARFSRLAKMYLPYPRRVHPYPSERFAS
ncbi:group II intron reverse transcriptase/maturase [Methyloversatilis discipulorum]|uniref:group II intron reverse transcriptase/maturase n=1 Tax=Methyloversatilis discipulorum TaxID=1119528 RepID=UPI003AF60FC2